ncbi:MAG: bifunctional DNA primase/polymerase [Acidimicrobiales bacterium]
MKASAMADAVFAYADRGWPVFPCHEARPAGCSCGYEACASVGKHPRTRRGLHEASTDRTTVERWWRAWPRANVAIRTGSLEPGAEGLVVVDIDPRHGGDASLDELVAVHGGLPETAVVRTGGQGRHLYFAHPGCAVRNSAGTRLGAGLDVRGDGGYVIAPPSVHANGRAYEWRSLASPAPLPEWLLDRLTTPSRPPSIAADHVLRCDAGVSAWAAAAMDGELARVAMTAEGGRNHALNRAAFALGQLVGGGHLVRDHVVAALEQAGQGVGLEVREVSGTIRSGMAAGEAAPRHPPRRGAGDNPTSRDRTQDTSTQADAADLDISRCDLPRVSPASPLGGQAVSRGDEVDLGWPA